MFSIAKVAGKLAIVGSAVYVTVDNSIWDKSEYANKAIGKVKQALPETTELIKDLPSTNTLTNTWNQGVEKVFDTLANSSSCVNEMTGKLMNYSSGLISSSNDQSK